MNDILTLLNELQASIEGKTRLKDPRVHVHAVSTVPYSISGFCGNDYISECGETLDAAIKAANDKCRELELTAKAKQLISKL